MQPVKIKWNHKDIPYGPDSRQKLDMACGKKDVHAIVYIHGGAYFTGSKSRYPSFLADFSENNLIASMDYRVISVDNTINLWDILSDVANALAKIIELSNENGITIKSFTLIGHSAGGHIGLLYGYRYFQNNKNIKITACVSLAGPTDFSDDIGWSSMEMWGASMKERLAFFSWMGTRLTGNTIGLTQYNWTKQKNYPQFKKYLEDSSPVMYAAKIKNLPPTLLVHGRGDNQVPYSNSVRLKAALRDTSIPHKLISPGGNESVSPFKTPYLPLGLALCRIWGRLFPIRWVLTYQTNLAVRFLSCRQNLLYLYHRFWFFKLISLNYVKSPVSFALSN